MNCDCANSPYAAFRKLRKFSIIKFSKLSHIESVSSYCKYSPTSVTFGFVHLNSAYLGLFNYLRVSSKSTICHSMRASISVCQLYLYLQVYLCGRTKYATWDYLFMIVTPPQRNSGPIERSTQLSHVVPSRYTSTTSTRDACLPPRYGSSSWNACTCKTFRFDASRSAFAKVTEVDSDAKEAVWGETKGRLCGYGQTGE